MPRTYFCKNPVGIWSKEIAKYNVERSFGQNRWRCPFADLVKAIGCGNDSIDTLDSTEFISTSLAIACADLNTWETAVSFISALTLVLIKSPEEDGCVYGCGPRKIYK